jgi:hypothetical protein
MTKISKNCTVLTLFWTVIEVPPRAFDRAGSSLSGVHSSLLVVGGDLSTWPSASLRTFALLQLAHLVAPDPRAND